MSKELTKIKNKIRIEDYTLKEYAEYFHLFNKKVLCLTLETKQIEICFYDSQLPHLIGLQYAYTKKVSTKQLRGQIGFQLLLDGKIDFLTFERRIRINRPISNGKIITWDMIKARIEWLPYFLNTIVKTPRMKQNLAQYNLVKSSLKGDYFYFKMNDSLYLILSLLLIKDRYKPESFIVYDDAKFLIGLPEIPITVTKWKELKKIA